MKPEYIPQEVWEAAFDAGENAYMAFSFYDAQAIVARAIMAAEKRGEEREREACALMVETFSPIRPAFETEDEGGTKWPHPAEQQPIYSPWKLAAAIRNRGKP